MVLSFTVLLVLPLMALVLFTVLRLFPLTVAMGVVLVLILSPAVVMVVVPIFSLVVAVVVILVLSPEMAIAAAFIPSPTVMMAVILILSLAVAMVVVLAVPASHDVNKVGEKPIATIITSQDIGGIVTRDRDTRLKEIRAIEPRAGAGTADVGHAGAERSPRAPL